MKWTKVVNDFAPGEPLNRLMAPGDILIPDPGTPVNPPEPNIWVSQNHNPVIDNCFRIYKDKQSLMNVIPKAGMHQIIPANYHSWVYHDNLPPEYFHPTYFYGSHYHIPHPYEVFCGGWIHIYDVEVRHGETDHAIYFDWDPNPKKRAVTVYILQTKPNIGWNVYIKITPPGSQDPPPPKGPPPPYC